MNNKKNEKTEIVDLLAGELSFPGNGDELVGRIGGGWPVARGGGRAAWMMVMMMMMMVVVTVVVMAGGGCLVGDHRRGCLHVLGRFSPRYDLRGCVVGGGGGSGDGNGGDAGGARGGGSCVVAVAGGGWSQAETFATPRRGGGYFSHPRSRTYVAEVNRGTRTSGKKQANPWIILARSV